MNISFWNSKDLHIWNQKLEQYWDKVKKGNRSIEMELENLDINKIKYMTLEEFYNFLYDRYFLWKFTNSLRLSQNRGHLKKYKNSSDEIYQLESIHKKLFTFDPCDTKQGLKIARQIHGLGIAGASGLLALLFPEYFGTVDKYVVEALQQIDDLSNKEEIKAIKPERININDGIIIINIFKEKANELNEIDITQKWTPRKIDMVLWGTRKEKNNKKCFQ